VVPLVVPARTARGADVRGEAELPGIPASLQWAAAATPADPTSAAPASAAVANVAASAFLIVTSVVSWSPSCIEGSATRRPRTGQA